MNQKLILRKSIAAFAMAIACLFSGNVSADLSADFDRARFLTAKDIPAHLADWLRLEQLVNNRFTGTIFTRLDHSQLDPRFDPKNEPVVLIGYLEIPRHAASIQIDESLIPASAKDVLFFKKDGIEYVRMFIHPLMETQYEEESKLYGEKYVDSTGKTRYRPKHGEYVAALSSSIRSWVVWDRRNPQNFIGEKTSVALELGGLDRKNDLDQLARAVAITQVMKDIPAKIRQEVGFEIFPEPVSQNTSSIRNGKTYGNITRIFPEPMSHPNGIARFAPGFSLTSPGPNFETPLLVELIAKSGKPAGEYIEQNLIEPLVRVYAYLTYVRGVVGEPHQQNVLFKRDDQGYLTQLIQLRDADAFKPDIELRHIHGHSDEPFNQSKRPYKLLKMAKAEHDYRRSYNAYVKGTWTEAIGLMIDQWKHLYPSLADGTNFAESFDKALLKELVKYFGFTAVFDSADMAASEQIEILERQHSNNDPSFDPAKLKEARAKVKQGTLAKFVAQNRAKIDSVAPGIDWNARPVSITLEQSKKIIDAFTVSELFLRNYVNNATTYAFDVNRIVDKFKKLNVQKPQAKVSQNVLRAEYERLVFNYRGSSTEKVPASAYFVLNKGSITALSAHGNPIGHAFLEPRSTIGSGKPYYAGSKYPRIEPDLSLLAEFYAFADGKISEIKDRATRATVIPISSHLAPPSPATRPTRQTRRNDWASVACSALFGAR